MSEIMVTTMNDLPGYRVDEVFGEVFGLTVRSRNIGSDIGAQLKGLVGGEVKGYTKMLAEAIYGVVTKAGCRPSSGFAKLQPTRAPTP